MKQLKKEDWLDVFPPQLLMIAVGAGLVFSIVFADWNADAVLNEFSGVLLFSIGVLLFAGMLIVGIVGFIVRRRSKRPTTFDEAIEKMVSIYRENPEGFFVGRGGAAEQQLRRIGEVLNEKGGMDLVRAAHAEFSSRCKVRGAPRNLELMWDFIGNWRG